MLEGINLFQLASARMQYLADRQSVIARNVANADTVGYVAHDLTPFDASAALQGGSGTSGGQLMLTRTSADHFAGTTTAAMTVVSTTVDGYEEKPDGNGVSVEEQMVKAADNTNAFALASAAYAKSISIMKLSIDK